MASVSAAGWPRTPWRSRKARVSLHHLRCIRAAHRRNAEADVPQNLHEDPSQTEHKKMAELRVAGGADNRLLTTQHHSLHLDAPDGCAGECLARLGRDAAEGPSHFPRVSEVERDTAGVGLVQNIREAIFRTTGKPIRSAAATASSAVAAISLGSTGMP